MEHARHWVDDTEEIPRRKQCCLRIPGLRYPPRRINHPGRMIQVHHTKPFAPCTQIDTLVECAKMCVAWSPRVSMFCSFPVAGRYEKVTTCVVLERPESPRVQQHRETIKGRYEGMTTHFCAGRGRDITARHPWMLSFLSFRLLTLSPSFLTLRI